MVQKNKVEIGVVFDYWGYPDYYSGHGHAFAPKNLIACLRFGFPINYSETVGEIVESILYDIQNWNIEVLEPKYEKELEKITDKQIERAVRDEFKDGVKNSDKFFDEPDLEAESQKDNDFVDYPYLIGYIHFYIEEPKPYKIA